MTEEIQTAKSEEWSIVCYDNHPAVTPPISKQLRPPLDGEQVLIAAYELRFTEDRLIVALTWAVYQAKTESFTLLQGRHAGNSYALQNYYRMDPLLEMAVDFEKSQKLTQA